MKLTKAQKKAWPPNPWIAYKGHQAAAAAEGCLASQNCCWHLPAFQHDIRSLLRISVTSVHSGSASQFSSQVLSCFFKTSSPVTCLHVLPIAPHHPGPRPLGRLTNPCWHEDSQPLERSAEGFHDRLPSIVMTRFTFYTLMRSENSTGRFRLGLHMSPPVTTRFLALIRPGPAIISSCSSLAVRVWIVIHTHSAFFAVCSALTLRSTAEKPLIKPPVHQTHPAFAWAF